MKAYYLLILLLIGCISEPIEVIEEKEAYTCTGSTYVPTGVVLGDILVPENKGVGLNTELWEDKIIPYYLDARWYDSPYLQDIYKVMDHLETLGFTFIPIELFDEKYPDYIYVKYAGFGYSYIGKKGGEQQIYLPTSYNNGAFAHEFGHVVGLGHTHNTPSSSEWLKFYPENMIEENKSFFEPWSSYDNTNRLYNSCEYLDYYDINSVMNYGSTAYSKNGEYTMTLKDGTPFNTVDFFSEGDNLTILRMYDYWEQTKNK